MKIYTATFFRDNYGSALQAYALQSKLRELGARPVIVDRKAGVKKLGTLQKLRLFLRPEKNYGLIRKLRRYAQQKMYREKSRKINRFISENISVLPFDRAVEEIEKEPCVLLAGSDQVWSTLNHPINGFYLFDYVKADHVRRVSYAASIGISEITPEQCDYYRQVLAPFDVVSLREKKACAELGPHLQNRVVRQDVDPTLLYDGSFWEKLIQKEGKEAPEEPFLFVYMLRPDKKVIRIAKKIARDCHLKIVYMGLYVNRYAGIRTIADGGIEDFLYYIKNAQIVVTNSFHGTVFSLLFEKKFVSVRLEGTSSRAEGLLESAGLSDHLIDREEEAVMAGQDYDYGEVRRRLDENRNRSIRYLQTVVNETEEGD